MKKFKLETMKMSKTADAKLQAKLYFMSFKKNIASIFTLGNIKFALPAFALLGVLVLGVNTLWNPSQTNNWTLVQTQTETAESWYSTVLRVLERRKTSKYKNNSLVRVEKSKTAKYKKYKNISSLRKAKLRINKKA